MFPHIAILLYRFINKTLGLRGGGRLMRIMSDALPIMRTCRLDFPGRGSTTLDLRDETVQALIDFSFGDLGHSAGLIRYLEKVLRPGECFWDVGANVVVVSLHFSHPRFQLKQIEVFEPNPALVKILRELFHENTMVCVHGIGVGDKDAELQLTIPLGSSSMASINREDLQGEKVTVPVRSGDSLLREAAAVAPDVIKIDVEGFEPQVIAGMAEIIRVHRSTIFFEHIFLTQQEIDALLPEGYTLYFIGDDSSLGSDPALREKSHDAIFLPKEKKPLLALPD